jgi:hypothetical protein
MKHDNAMKDGSMGIAVMDGKYGGIFLRFTQKPPTNLLRQRRIPKNLKDLQAGCCSGKNNRSQEVSPTTSSQDFFNPG